MRIPKWLRRPLPRGPEFARTRDLVGSLGLHTVCQSAKCPNMAECFSRSVATFMVLGDHCTRNCAFCNIASGGPEPVDPDEPRRVAQGAALLGLKYVVVTSVTRDDLPDGGAGHFAAVIRALRESLPEAGVEVLIPDFQGDEAALGLVLEAGPDVVNHNVETVPALYPRIRPQARYPRSLELLARVARAGLPAKSGLMVGLGEDVEGVHGVLADLAGVGVSIATVGQYMRPSREHPLVVRYWEPAEFDALAEHGRSLGIAHMHSAPLVRSSYRAGESP